MGIDSNVRLLFLKWDVHASWGTGLFCMYWNTLSHISSFKVIWSHIASFRVSWSQTHCDSTWLKLSQAVSICLKMLQKYYYGLTWIMCTLPAYEINESCVPIDSSMTVVLFWHFFIDKMVSNTYFNSSVSQRILFASSSGLWSLYLLFAHPHYIGCLVIIPHSKMRCLHHAT